MGARRENKSRRTGPARTFGPPASEVQRQRVERGWTQSDVGAMVGALLGRDAYTGGYIHRIETLEYPATPEISEALARLFAVSVDVMRGWLAPPQESAA